MQIRLPGFTGERLVQLGLKVRDLYAAGAGDPVRIREVADEAYIDDLAKAVGGRLGGKVGVAPRIFLKKLVGDVLDRIDQFEEFDPRLHYQLTLSGSELTDIERNAAAADDIGLEL